MTIRVMRCSGDVRAPIALSLDGRHQSDLWRGDSVDMNFEDLELARCLTVRTLDREATIEVVDPGLQRLLGIQVRSSGWRAGLRSREALQLEVAWVADDPAELVAWLATDPDAAAGWKAASGYVKHVYIEWIRKPRRAGTRQSRAAETAVWAAGGVLESHIQHPTLGDAALALGP